MLFKYMYVEAAVHVTIQTFTLVQGFFLLQVDRWNKKKNQTVYLMSIMQYAIYLAL